MGLEVRERRMEAKVAGNAQRCGAEREAGERERVRGEGASAKGRKE